MLVRLVGKESLFIDAWWVGSKRLPGVAIPSAVIVKFRHSELWLSHDASSYCVVLSYSIMSRRGGVRVLLLNRSFFERIGWIFVGMDRAGLAMSRRLERSKPGRATGFCFASWRAESQSCPSPSFGSPSFQALLQIKLVLSSPNKPRSSSVCGVMASLQWRYLCWSIQTKILLEFCLSLFTWFVIYWPANRRLIGGVKFQRDWRVSWALKCFLVSLCGRPLPI